MKVLIATDYTVVKYDKKLYCSSAFYTILKRYYDAFGKVALCTRVINATQLPEKRTDITDMIDEVCELRSLADSLAKKQIYENAVKKCDMVIARVPSIVSFAVVNCAKKWGKPYMAESMGCAWDAYWNHGIVGKIIAPYMYFKMKSVVKNADYGLYVTEKFLQNRYPCKNETIAASNVKITDVVDTVLEKRLEKISNMDKTHIALMTSAAVDVRYKGHEYVIKAIPKLKKLGIHITYYMVGGGDQTYLKSIAEKNGVTDSVIFTGRLSLEEVLEKLDGADIYIQPSLQEGLPRAMIEAMSRGCVCLGAKTAGIPELVDPECIFKRKNTSAIVKCISSILKKDFEYYAKRNFDEAKKYKSDVLDDRRNKYFAKIADEIK